MVELQNRTNSLLDSLREEYAHYIQSIIKLTISERPVDECVHPALLHDVKSPKEIFAEIVKEMRDAFPKLKAGSFTKETSGTIIDYWAKEVLDWFDYWLAEE